MEPAGTVPAEPTEDRHGDSRPGKRPATAPCRRAAARRGRRAAAGRAPHGAPPPPRPSAGRARGTGPAGAAARRPWCPGRTAAGGAPGPPCRAASCWTTAGGGHGLVGSSRRVGLASPAAPGAGAVAVPPADRPGTSAAAVARLRTAYGPGAGPGAAAYGGRRPSGAARLRPLGGGGRRRDGRPRGPRLSRRPARPGGRASGTGGDLWARRLMISVTRSPHSSAASMPSMHLQ